MGMWLGACLGWLLGLFAGSWAVTESLPPGVAMLAGGILFLVAATGMAWGRLRAPLPGGWRLASVALLLASLACASTGWRAQQRLAGVWPEAFGASWITTTVRVQGLPQLRPQGWQVQVAVLNWEDAALASLAKRQRVPRQLGLWWPAPVDQAQTPLAGEVWRINVRLRAPDAQVNPAGRLAGWGAFLRGDEAVGAVRPGAQRLTTPARSGLSLQDRMDRWRQAVRAEVFQRVPDRRVAGILVGLSVGDASAIDPNDWEVLRRTGMAHAVSISGAHVALLGSVVAWLVRRAWGHSAWLAHRCPAVLAALWLGCALSAGYAWASGWGVPAQRTVWMMLTLATLRTWGRDWPWPLVLLSAACVVSACDPWTLHASGFWLSFVAVAILLATLGPAQSALGEAAVWPGASEPPDGRAQAAPAWAPWSRVRQEGQALWRTQRVVTVALTPLSLVCFQQASVVGLGANLLTLPAFALVITPLALLGVACPWAWDMGAWVTRMCLDTLAWMAQPAFAVLATPVLPPVLVPLVVFGGMALALPVPWRWRMVGAVALLPLWHLPEDWRLLPRPGAGQFHAVVVDVGQGTAVLVRTATKTLLFDTGGRLPSGADQGQRVLLPLLQAMGERSIDLLVLSHDDADHAGGLPSVFAHWPVSAWLSPTPEDHPLRQLPGQGGMPVPHTPCVQGQRWTWDGVQFDVLHPAAARLPGQGQRAGNDVSCVLRVQTLSASAPEGGQAPARSPSLLITGDIESPQEAELVRLHRSGAQGLRSTVLVVPHHGSRTSSTEAFLQAVQPALAVAQVGARNSYGHPHPSVVARYQRLGLPWVSTPSCGAWVWRSDEAMPAASSGRGWPAPPQGPGEAHAIAAWAPPLGRCWRHWVQDVHRLDRLADPPEP